MYNDSEFPAHHLFTEKNIRDSITFSFYMRGKTKIMPREVLNPDNSHKPAIVGLESELSYSMSFDTGSKIKSNKYVIIQVTYPSSIKHPNILSFLITNFYYFF